MDSTTTVTQDRQGSSWAQADEPDCPVCKGDRVIEVEVFGRFAVEATRVTRCPKCRDGKPVRSAA